MYTYELFLSKTCFTYKILEELCVVTLKGDKKFKGKLADGLNNVIRNLVNFHVSGGKPGNLHFGWLLLSKPYKDLDEKVQTSYVSRQ